MAAVCAVVDDEYEKKMLRFYQVERLLPLPGLRYSVCDTRLSLVGCADGGLGPLMMRQWHSLRRLNRSSCAIEDNMIQRLTE